jgi:hypothetical protein
LGGAITGKTILRKISRTNWSISIKFYANHPWLKRIKNCPNEGLGSCPWGDNRKNGVRSMKNVLLSNLHESFLTWSSGVGRANKRGNYFYMYTESFKMKHLANFNQTCYKPLLFEGNSSLMKGQVLFKER